MCNKAIGYQLRQFQNMHHTVAYQNKTMIFEIIFPIIDPKNSQKNHSIAYQNE